MELKGKTVLVVDDEKDLCEIIATELHDHGAETRLAHSVNGALQVLDSQTVDLVVSDIRMPGGASGIELLTTIHSRWSELPVVMISGYADIPDDEILRRGAQALVSKPFDFDELVRLCVRLTHP